MNSFQGLIASELAEPTKELTNALSTSLEKTPESSEIAIFLASSKQIHYATRNLSDYYRSRSD